MSSTERFLTSAERQELLRTAREVIEHSVAKGGTPADFETSSDLPLLRQPGASFVTLEHGGRLRGCIGTLEPCRALIADVAANAHGAAFRDPRFPSLGRDELPGLSVAISVLSPREPLQFDSEKQLLGLLRPGTDGLVLSCGHNRGTFLPSVWETLRTPDEFLRHLKMKAGLQADFWSDRITIERYTTEYFSG